MGKDAVPSVRSLEKPEDPHTLLRQDYEDDCLSCRLVGGGTLFMLAGFNYVTGTRKLEARRADVLKSGSIFGMRSRRAGIAGLSLCLASMGLFRLVR